MQANFTVKYLKNEWFFNTQIDELLKTVLKYFSYNEIWEISRRIKEKQLLKIMFRHTVNSISTWFINIFAIGQRKTLRIYVHRKRRLFRLDTDIRQIDKKACERSGRHCSKSSKMRKIKKNFGAFYTVLHGFSCPCKQRRAIS